MRSAIRCSRIMSTRELPSTYSEWLRVCRPVTDYGFLADEARAVLAESPFDPTVGNAATLGTSGTSRTVASEHPVEAAVHGQFGGTSPGEHGASVCEPNSYCLPRQ
jgi:hypothetical protein